MSEQRKLAPFGAVQLPQAVPGGSVYWGADHLAKGCMIKELLQPSNEILVFLLICFHSLLGYYEIRTHHNRKAFFATHGHETPCGV